MSSALSALSDYLSTTDKRFIPFSEPQEAFDHLCKLYDQETSRLQKAFAAFKSQRVANGELKGQKIQGFYPCLRIEVDEDHINLDPRLSHGVFKEEGVYELNVADPRLMHDLLGQLKLLATNSPGIKFQVGLGQEEIPIEYAMRDVNFSLGKELSPEKAKIAERLFKTKNPALCADRFDAESADSTKILLPYNGQRYDHAINQFFYYTRTPYEALQPFVLFSNYDQYVDEFHKYGIAKLKEPFNKEAEGRGKVPHVVAVIRTGHKVEYREDIDPELLVRLKITEAKTKKGAQMNACHIMMSDGLGYSIINAGVGDPNIRNIGHLIATKRPHAWVMAGHAAGFSTTQNIGDFVYADDYYLNDPVCDASGIGTDYACLRNLTIPASSEIQRSFMAEARQYAESSKLDVDRIYRTAAIVSTSNRNWEQIPELHNRIFNARAYALDMETAYLARLASEHSIPFGGLLKISDMPLLGKPKSPSSADDFFGELGPHLGIILGGFARLKEEHLQSLHSRKLRPPFGAFVMQ